MLTEDEAKTKWCPHAVASHTDPRRGFHGTDQDQYGAAFPCIGSACMAWRKALRHKTAPNTVTEYREWDEPNEWDVVGYCGLAGKP